LKGQRVKAAARGLDIRASSFGFRHYLAPFSFQKVRDRQVAAATAPLSVLFVFIRVP